MKIAVIGMLGAALLATGCQFKSTDPVITTSGNQPLPSPSKVPVTLAWTASTGTVQGYKVEASLDGATFYELGTVQANPGSSSIAVSVSLPGGATYYFRVRSFNQGGNSAYSAVASVKI